MFLWIAAGYVLSAVAFYSYIVATAQEEPQQGAATLHDTNERQWVQDNTKRKAA